MKLRPLGRSNLQVAPLALGGNVFGWTIDEPVSFAILDAFLDSGLNLIDTADMYSRWKPGNQGGESETIIGRWLRRRSAADRGKVLIATKCGMEMGPNEKGLSKAYILRAVEASLRRLQIDTIDLYQAHQDDPSTPLEETMSAFAHLIKEGKVRAVGASNYTAPRLAEALRISGDKGLPRYECLQPHYNLIERAGFEAELEPLCLKERLGVLPYFSLASGFLTGKYRSEADLSKSVRGKGMTKYLNDRGRRILAALDTVTARYRVTPAQVALAWLIARPSVTAPIASATSLGQLNDLVAATRLELDRDAVRTLDEAGA
ncbi:MAG TPA: aldo/keto reductase [Tepidisphaeraceae bacterium]|jgi:aryl-alcohol dehydrogenase-like predicted oxidoreductase